MRVAFAVEGGWRVGSLVGAVVGVAVGSRVGTVVSETVVAGRSVGGGLGVWVAVGASLNVGRAVGSEVGDSAVGGWEVRPHARVVITRARTKVKVKIGFMYTPWGNILTTFHERGRFRFRKSHKKL
jgi:hypothetical protein